MFVSALFLLSLTSPVMAQKTNGKFSQIPAFYDGKLFTITFQELPPSAEKALLAHNASINFIYQSDLVEECNTGQAFTSVIDAIQADGFNPLWNEVQICFETAPAPCTCTTCPSAFQLSLLSTLKSDDLILAAAAANEICLSQTTEVYTCAVVGPGPKKPK